MKPVTVRPASIPGLSILAPLIIATIVIAALYFGREVLIPFALALLLSFLLTPPVTWLEKLRLGRIASVLIVLVLAFAVLGAIVWLGTTQLADIVSKVPEYQENIQRKIAAMRNPAGSALSKVADSVRQLSTDVTANPAATSQDNLTASAKGSKAGIKAPPVRGPIAVEVVKHEPGMVESLGLIGASSAHFIGVAAAVLIFALFMLLQRGDLRNRVFQLIGAGHLNVMTNALDDAARGISRYLLTQAIINGTFGLLLGLGLYWIGVPNAPFWGVLGAILRFVPYIGTLIAGACPLLLAIAVFDGWAKPMLTLGLFAAIELMMSAALEPWLYGAHTGISSMAILVSATFWTLLWGPIGLVLSTPLTVCLLAIGRYAPPLKFLGVLLGDKAVLPPAACFYQRLLAMDDDEAQEIAQTYLKERTFCDLYDFVLVPALSFAERDRHRNALDDEREEFIYRTTKTLIEDLAEETSPEPATPLASPPSILSIPARDQADELVGLMVAHILARSGQNVATLPIGPMEDMLKALQQHQPDILLVSALPPFALSQAQSICRRARRRFRNLKIIVGFWGSDEDIDRIQERLGAGCFDKVVTSISQAEFQVKLLAGVPETPPNSEALASPEKLA